MITWEPIRPVRSCELFFSGICVENVIDFVNCMKFNVNLMHIFYCVLIRARLVIGPARLK